MGYSRFMLIKCFAQSFILTILIAVVFVSPSYAGEGAPEIPAGFGPILITGIAFSSIALKSYFDKKDK